MIFSNTACAEIFAVVLVFLAAAAGAQGVAPDVHVGDNWKFRTADGFTDETQYESTQRVVQINDGEIVVELRNVGKDKTVLRYFTREWNIVDSDDGKYDPYYPEFKFPLVASATWSEKYTWLPGSGIAASGYVKATVSAQEKVTVPAGTFDAYRIDREQEVRVNNETAIVTSTHMTTWYAPAVRRFVRRDWTVSRDGRVRGKTSMELIEYTLVGQH